MPDDIDISRILGQIETAIKPLETMAQDVSKIQIILAGLPCKEHSTGLADVETRLAKVEMNSAEMRPKVDLFWRITTIILLTAIAAIAALGKLNGGR